MPLSLFHLHGDLKDLRFPRLLAALREDDFTGVFQATTRSAGRAAREEDEVTREVHFSSGHVAWAISTDREESLRAYLLRSGTLTEARWVEAEERARDGTLRQALIDLGIVKPRELTQIEKGRAEEIVLALFSAREGEYRVRERQLSPGTPDLGVDPRPLILRGVLERGDRALILDEIGSLDTVYVVKRPSLDQPSANLPGEFQSVMRHIDGKRSIANICSLTSLPDNFVCSVFAALSIIGAVRRNYEKSHARSGGEIVRGLEVAVQQTMPVQETAPEEPPPISRQPFPGEGPVTSLAAASETEEEREEQDTEEEPDLIPEETPPPPPREVRMPSPSAYAEPAPGGDTSRPWFLLGGAAAVGFAALFLILMAQNPGDAGEGVRPVAQPEAQTSEPAPPALPPPAASPAEPEKAENPDKDQSSPVIAPSVDSNILNSAPEDDRTGPKKGSGRDNLVAGDYLSASRYFGREVKRHVGQYTIQLLTACQDETVRRAVDGARGSPDLFILSTRLEGRNCYRVFWGKYSSQTRAREALRRDIPSSFRQEKAQPRITRIGG